MDTERLLRELRVARLREEALNASALSRAILNATVLRATCEKGEIHRSFRVHLREEEWDAIVELAKKEEGR